MPLGFDLLVLVFERQPISWQVVFSDPSTYLIGFGIAASGLGEAAFDKRRTGQVSLSYIIAIVLSVLTLVMGAAMYALAGVIESRGIVGFGLLSWFYDAGIAVVALAVAYAIVKHRVFDIAFVLNRTLVFTATSAIVVVMLVGLEFLIERYLDSLTRVEGLVLQFAIALGVALSIRALHRSVDRFVDTVFFRKRHEDEHAIRDFAQEAAYITDRHTLLHRTVEVLERHTDAAFVDLHFDHTNDAALVKLRAWHTVLDLHTVETTLRGDWAYPMVSRGRVIGVLVLGPKRSAELYAPDESDAIGQVAHSVAAALELLGPHRDSSLDRIEALLEKLPERLAESVRSGGRAPNT